MTMLVARRMPVVFAVSGAPAIPGLLGPFSIPREAEGIVVVTARRLERSGAAAMLGPHVMSPPYLPSSSLEERVLKALRAAGIDVPANRRVPAALPLPDGLAGNSVPLVVLTLDLTLGFDRFGDAGAALRELREEGIVLAGIAGAGAEMFATVSLLVGAAFEDDRIAGNGLRDGAAGFVLVPELHDAFEDEGCCLWSVEAAGEMPHEVLLQLRRFLSSGEDGENHDMRKKKAAAFHITRFDKTRLMDLLRSLDAAHENRGDVEELERELERGTEVDSTEVGADVVTMNSTVRVTDEETSATQLYTIVFPADADYDRGRISILSPLGTALLGARAGDVVTSGTRRLRIEELVYQPEAAGDFHL